LDVQPQRTKIVTRPVTFRILPRDRDLMFLAAQHEGIAQSEFLRRAIRERATRVVTDAEAPR
jgi:uncharacterized protein (DUF1778 family)